MAVTRDNHYVSRWYQEGFFLPGQKSLAYLDMSPNEHLLPNSRTVQGRSLFDSTPSRAFFQTDLYSTFFGASVNDEIERRLFGDIDTRGSNAARAFIGTDISEWHRHFEALFEYIDVQKNPHAERPRLAPVAIPRSHSKRIDVGNAGHSDDALHDLDRGRSGDRDSECF